MNALIIITIYLIGVLFAYMKHCGFISSILYAYSIDLDSKEKKEEYLQMIIFIWLSWIWFLRLLIDYFKYKEKYFFKLKL